MAFADQFELMANYNQWINDKIYTAANELGTELVSQDLGAFFGSVLGTLNHIMVADIIWLKRFATHPANFRSIEFLSNIENPKSLDALLFSDLQLLQKERKHLDQAIIALTEEATEADYNQTLTYSSLKGAPARKKFGFVMCHFFNHQTHHRGQITTLLNQNGIDIGVTDLLAVVPDIDQ